MKRTINHSELLLNEDGSVFHLHLKPGDVGDYVVLVGDPSRVNLVASFFSETEKNVRNREFVSSVGRYGDKRITVVSTGIGQDNIDIVLNELDALVNVDFATMQERERIVPLNLVRLGTSGAVRPDLREGDCVLSGISVGIDSLLRFYAGGDSVCLTEFEEAFLEQMAWSPQLSRPYAVAANPELAARFADMTVEGITLSAPGFYAPQGRWLRLRPLFPDLVERLERFEFRGKRFSNIEMESSALFALAALMGHKAVTICLVIAQRVRGSGNAGYQDGMKTLVEKVLNRL